ncbi:MAG: PD-(D/E)XK nuclease family protein, partial [Myxococcales bacterium]|nr:PD-(D/E)XK nuclease family protein [Myxococcales bacterium]
MEGFVDGIDARARVSLDRNYRSRPEVLAFINGLLAGCRRVQFRALTAELPPAGDGPRVHVAMARADTVAEARQIEADWIAARVVERLARGAALRDMAVLLRWTSGADLYERKLNEAGIDAHVDRGGAVLSTQEAAELTALLRVVDRPDDALAMAIVLKSPLCGLSDLGLYHLLWDQPPESLARTLRERVDLLTGADRARMDAFVAWWPRALGGAGRRAPAEIVREAVAASDYLVRLAWGADGEERVANAEQFLDVLGRYDPGPGPRDALELLDRLRREDWKDRPVPGGEGDDRVRIQTVHAAKGLEFPIVFVADLANSRKTTPPPYYLFEPPGRFALAVSNPHAKRLGLSGAKMAPASYAALNAIHQQRAEAENARLLYVALTRAQEHLYLSAACRTSKWTGWAGEFLQGIEIDDERGPEERAVPGAPEASYTFTFLTDSGAAPASFEATGVVTELPTDAERALAWALIDAARRPMPSAHGPHEVITATELLAFVECPRRYFLEQVLGRATSRRSARDASVSEPADEAASDPGSDELDPSGAVGAAELGVAAHALLETWRPERGDPLDATAEAVCRAHGVGSARDRRALMEWAEGFHASDLGRRARDAERVHRELPFASRVGDVEVRGTIDLLWFERDGTPVLVDYKTTVTDAARRRAAGPIYGLQLALYALAIERAGWGTAREGYLYYLRDGAVETVDLSTEALDRALGWIDALLGAQRAGAYPPADPPCARCPHPARCARSGPGL